MALLVVFDCGKYYTKRFIEVEEEAEILMKGKEREIRSGF